MSDQVGNPEDRFSRVAAQIIIGRSIGNSKTFKFKGRGQANLYNFGWTLVCDPLCANFYNDGSHTGHGVDYYFSVSIALL